MVKRYEQPTDFRDLALGITADPKVFEQNQGKQEEQKEQPFQGRRFRTVVHNQGRREVYPPTNTSK